jgi:hypothetical protein
MFSHVDLANAAKNFKFALVPRISSELATVTLIEFMAQDERSYKHWVRTFSEVIKSYDANSQNRYSVNSTIRNGETSGDAVVHATNDA